MGNTTESINELQDKPNKETSKEKAGRILKAMSAAETPTEAFSLFKKSHEDHQSLIFTFKGWTYQGYQKAGDDEPPVITLLVKGLVEVLYTLFNDEDEYCHKATHRAVITSENCKDTFEFVPDDCTNLNKFETRLENYSTRAYFKDKKTFKSYLDYIFSGNHLLGKKTPRVRGLQKIGYDKKSSAFVTPHFAYNTDGDCIQLGKNRYFESLSLAPAKAEKYIKRSTPISIKEFVDTLYAAYGTKGLLALGFYVSSTFAHLITESTNHFPFLSLFGDASCGKSFMIKRLNQCFFFNDEGVPMSKGTTLKGKIRSLSQKVSMVTVFIEATLESVRPGEIDSIVLPLYDRNSPQLRAKTTNDNQTHETPFEGTLAFVQNIEPFVMKAAKQRVVSLEFKYDKAQQAQTREAWSEFNDYKIEELASIGHSVLSKRQFFEEQFVEAIQNTKSLFENKHNMDGRIASNHAICHTGFRLFSRAFGIEDETRDSELLNYTLKLAQHKEDTAQDNTPYAFEFFESLFTYPESTPNNLDNAGYKIVDGFLYLHLSTATARLDGHFDQARLRREISMMNEVIDMSKQVKLFSSGSKNQRCIFLSDISEQYQ